MTAFQYIKASLWHYRRIHLAVLAGVIVATAVITGALLVGDSVRGSLRELVLERLGSIETLLVAEQPFREKLAEEIGESDDSAPLLLVEGSLSTTQSKSTRRATKLSVFGMTEDFWKFGDQEISGSLKKNEVIITQSLANELGAEANDRVLLLLPNLSSLPAESTLGEKLETTTSRRMRIAQVIPDQGLARFSLRPSQMPPRNVFVDLNTLQDLLDLSERVNCIAFAKADSNKFKEQLLPTLDDFNITIEESSPGIASATAKRLVLSPGIVEDICSSLPQDEIQPVVTYLANTLSIGDRQIPYSTICGVDSTLQLGPLLDAADKPIEIADDEIVLNNWAAEDLGAKIGDTITITYYEPETTHGELREAAPIKLKLRAIAPLFDTDGKPTKANDARLTPPLPGVTDQRSISDWDLPFELVETIRQQDEDYWDEYSTTPKAFVSYQLAARLWKTRWGTDSVLRIPLEDGQNVKEIAEAIHPSPEANGMLLVPVKQQGLAAAKGTTAFEGLFVGFSFFLMASAIMLIALLFRMGVDNRASEAGLLATLGLSPKKLRKLWIGETGFVVLLGALLGTAAGVAYAKLMIYGLTTWWVEAITTPFLKLHITSQSLLIGFLLGIGIALITISRSLRKLLKLPNRQLLAGDCEDHQQVLSKIKSNKYWLPPVMLGLAIGFAFFAFKLEGEAQAGAFFGSGALVLTALLTLLAQRLRKAENTPPESFNLTGLASRNARRNPSRSVLSVALTAVACFLIVALSAFRLSPTEQGTGGFNLISTADQPIHFDLNTPSGREELGFGKQDEETLSSISIQSLRIQQGEDASCLNLYQTSQPQVIGVPESFYEKNKFGWAAFAKTNESNPWQLLNTKLGEDSNDKSIIPIVLDKNTAAYSLHLSGIRSQLEIRDTADNPVTLQVVGLLSGSVLQGKLLMSEENFLNLFPDTAGYELFLLDNQNPEVTTEQLTELLESQLEDYGFDATSAEEQLGSYLAVQNTYLSTFQSLGALGLLLGTVGLAVSQLRSIIERRGELALMRSTGYRNSRLAKLVLGENSVLLLTGLGIGCLAALVAVLPHWIAQSADTPWLTLAILLLVILTTGLVAGLLAVRAALKAPLLPALRGD